MQDLQLMYVLLFKHNHKLEEYLREAELGTLFALSWPLTWFSHVLDDYQQVGLFHINTSDNSPIGGYMF